MLLHTVSRTRLLTALAPDVYMAHTLRCHVVRNLHLVKYRECCDIFSLATEQICIETPDDRVHRPLISHDLTVTQPSPPRLNYVLFSRTSRLSSNMSDMMKRTLDLRKVLASIFSSKRSLVFRS